MMYGLNIGLILGLSAATSISAFLAPCLTSSSSSSAIHTSRTRHRHHSSTTILPLMMAADGIQESKGWPVGRAVKTFLSFNRPRVRETIRKIVGRDTNAKKALSTPPQIGADLPLASGIVLVTGATGGVGKRVIDLLRKKGIRVRGLARNKKKALLFLSEGKEPEPGSGLEVVEGDITKPERLTPAVFEGVVAVVACTAAIVQPKVGDTEDRAKYYQGVKYYEPTTVDQPKDVDYQGIVNTVNAALKYGDLKEKKLFGCSPMVIDRWKQWAGLDDVVMGGRSDSQFTLVPGAGEDSTAGGSKIGAVFNGKVTSEAGFASGGFVSIRTRNLDPPLDLTGYKGIKLRVKGDGNRYKFILRDEEAWDGPSWSTMIDTVAGQWMDIKIPFSELIPVIRTQTIPIDKRRAFKYNEIYAIQIMLSKFAYDGELNPKYKEGDFQMVIQSIDAYTEATTPNIVYISSAGVTRPGRPGLDLDQEPPAVRMNNMLGGILTYKLKGEDTIRESGLRYTVIRPTALTEEPAGMPLQVDQADVIKGKISREDVAQLIVQALTTPAASKKTFEIKSTVPFSQPWTAEAAAAAPPTNWQALFDLLK